MSAEEFDKASHSIKEFDRESHILIVDDDPTLLKFYKIHLNKFFSKVVVVKSAADAVGVLDNGFIDLVVTDIRMPRTNGLQLMKKILSKHEDIPVLVVSGASLSEAQEKSLEGADGFLRKPFSIDDLNTFIREGIELRQKLLALKDYLKDGVNVRKALKKQNTIVRYLKDKESKAEVLQLFSEISSKAS